MAESRTEFWLRALASIHAGRLPHAVLLVGPPGAGKATAARRIARALLCPEARGRCEPRLPEDGCGVCAGCRQIETGTHPDLNWVTADEGTLKLAQIQELTRAVQVRAVTGRRLAVVEHAERMTSEAANALLRTLEEPPSGAHFLLLAAKPAALPVTVQSRCQPWRLPPLAVEEIAAWLVTERGLELEEARAAAERSGGWPGRALAGLEPGFADLVRRVQDLAVRLVGARDVEILDWAEAWDADEASLTDRLDELAGLLRDALALAAGADRPLLLVPDREPVARQLAQLPLSALALAVERVHLARRQLARNASRRLVLEVLFWDLRRLLSAPPGPPRADQQPGRPAPDLRAQNGG